MNDTTHLHALQVRLSHERERFANAKNSKERELRQVWIRQIEKEIRDEEVRVSPISDEIANMTDEELIAALTK